jgi:hypothetical protein
MIEKPRCIRHKPKFLCILCKGYHLTRMFPAIVMVQEAQSFSNIPSGSKSYLVSQDSNPSLVDTTVISMPSSVDTTLVFGSDILFKKWSCHFNLQSTPLLFWGVMCI